jgi:hypothetical protein
MIQHELFQVCAIITIKAKIGGDMSSMNSKVAERQFLLLPIQIRIVVEQAIDDRMNSFNL